MNDELEARNENFDAPSAEPRDNLEVLEIKLFLEAVYRHYGFDFRDYALASVYRRIWKRISAEGLTTVSGLQEKVLHDPACMERFLLDLTIHVTSMFRDPGFYLAFRSQVVPLLRTYPFVRIWMAGCSTGEEVYSMAILLEEEGIYEKSRIYATDMSELVLDKAKNGMFPLAAMKEYTANYQQAGGGVSFSNYYTANYDHALFRPSLKEHIVFAQHNLATDAPFNEFNVIVCRNVMIYFNQALQQRVHGMFYDSLCMFGMLVVGKKESIKFSAFERRYEPLDAAEKIFRKVR